MINWKEKGKGLIEFLSENGVSIEHRNRVTIQHSNKTDEEVQALIDNYDPIPLAREEAKKRIIKQSELAMSDIEKMYPSFERQTFPYQVLEVEAWDADKTALTPTIDAIAESRGLDRIEQLNRTLAKTTQFKQMSSMMAGKRQYFEDLINQSDDLNIINSINFEP